MHISRRRMIGLIGGGAVLAVAPAIGFLSTRLPERALAPWGLAGQYNEPRRRALSYAILAPNPHNRQPWLAELVGEDELLIHRDHALNLPETDPYDRQLTIGIGCFLEVLRMAAGQDGYALATTLFPEGEGGPVAKIRFGQGGVADPLFAQVLSRHTNRQGYDARPLPGSAQTELSRYARIISAAPEVAALQSLTWQAMELEMLTARVMQESIDLMRLGKAEIEARPDGISLGGPFVESLMLLGMLNRADLADPNSAAFKQGLAQTKAAMAQTPAYAVLTSGENTREAQILAGRDWVRLHLAATGLGLSMQPVSQALQEYPEMGGYFDQVHKMLAKPGERVQMLGRLGYGPAIHPSPRWPMETRIADARQQI